ncbi:hypothetical protein [Okibacterium fritillariae]|uniref:Uncharacterized protein n=1 Tax=Okibacterium fritillariae TaxID=123320 RepID=A0A1T5JU00_9MICO|nr:hypothetical protein [Okibacterium fritillariae]SKC54851.1 hypothetical protein SAMN06309945_1865 [Okibacterium fritillariae]
MSPSDVSPSGWWGEGWRLIAIYVRRVFPHPAGRRVVIVGAVGALVGVVGGLLLSVLFARIGSPDSSVVQSVATVVTLGVFFGALATVCAASIRLIGAMERDTRPRALERAEERQVRMLVVHPERGQETETRLIDVARDRLRISQRTAPSGLIAVALGVVLYATYNVMLLVQDDASMNDLRLVAGAVLIVVGGASLFLGFRSLGRSSARIAALEALLLERSSAPSASEASSTTAEGESRQ